MIGCRKRKDRHEGGAPSGFSRFPAAEGDSDEDEDYEKERRKRSEHVCSISLIIDGASGFELTLKPPG